MSSVCSTSVTAWTPRPDLLTESNACEEEEENQGEKNVVLNDSRTPERKPSFHYFPPSQGDRADASCRQTTPSKYAIYSNIS